MVGNTPFFQIQAVIPYPMMSGDVISVTTVDRTIIILNSAKAAIDILDKRSSIYSDRPYFTMAGELMGFDNSLALLPYNVRFNETRRVTKGAMGPGAVRVFEELEKSVCLRFLGRVLDTPENFLAHIRQ